MSGGRPSRDYPGAAGKWSRADERRSRGGSRGPSGGFALSCRPQPLCIHAHAWERVCGALHFTIFTNSLPKLQQSSPEQSTRLHIIREYQFPRLLCRPIRVSQHPCANEQPERNRLLTCTSLNDNPSRRTLLDKSHPSVNPQMPIKLPSPPRPRTPKPAFVPESLSVSLPPSLPGSSSPSDSYRSGFLTR